MTLTLSDLLLTQDTFQLTADLTVGAEAVTAVIGPSGGGKSTLLAGIAGFLAPAAGRIFWDGGDITTAPPADRPVTMIFQDNNLFPHLDATTNVVLGATTRRRPPPETLEKARAALDTVGLGGLGDRMPAQLSGGQQSRVALARTLLSDRPVVLMDEPYAALGPALKAELMDLTTRLMTDRGATVLIVTHDPDDARRFAPQTILVADGRAAPPQDTQPLLDDPPPALAAYIGQRSQTRA